MNYDMTYCTSTDCPYTDCARHLEHLIKEKEGTFAKHEADCRKYLGWLAYSNYEKYLELKEKQNEKY